MARNPAFATPFGPSRPISVVGARSPHTPSASLLSTMVKGGSCPALPFNNPIASLRIAFLTALGPDIFSGEVATGELRGNHRSLPDIHLLTLVANQSRMVRM